MHVILIMASFLCKCGNQISNTLVPNEVEYRVYNDFEWDKILENDVVNVLDLPEPSKDVWKCPKCERVYIFSQTGEVEKVYKLEN